MKLTLVIKNGKNSYLIGQLKEFTSVFTQVSDINELKVNILDVLDMYLDDLREQYLPDENTIQEEVLVFA